MSRIVIIGSGASGVHFAQAALQLGHHVTMIDVGTELPKTVLPNAYFDDLKSLLSNPSDYFLGQQFQGALLPGNDREYYGIPPSKEYVFASPNTRRGLRKSGFEPLFSFAQGGLAEAWTAGCYPYNEAELEAFPWGYAELEPHYNAIAKEIGITGADDDTSRFFPVHDHLMPGLKLDEHSQRLWLQYARRRKSLNHLGAYIGRSRVATLSRDYNDRQGCWYSGRCLWGCPSGSLYTPSQTLRQSLSHDQFDYRRGLFANHLILDSHDRAEAVVATDLSSGEVVRIGGDAVVLAAGTLCSSRIFLETLRQNRDEIVKLHGLMDNRQILVPFLTLSMMGRPVRTDRYQYHQLMMALDQGRPADLVHCQLTTLKSAAVHPIIQSIPLNLKLATKSFREIRAALGIANVNLADNRRAGNYVTLQTEGDSRPASLVISYSPPDGETARLQTTLKLVRKCLWKLGAIAPAAMTHVRPMGASVHYAGTLPMSAKGRSLTTTPNGRSHDIPNLYLVDGSTFCFLPAKNLTFTLMANARRIAFEEFA